MSAATLGRPRLFSALFLGDTWPLWGVLGAFCLALALMFGLTQHRVLPGQMSAMLALQTLLAMAAPAVGLASLARVRRVMDAALMPRAALQRSARGLAWALWGWWALMSLPSVLLVLWLTPGFEPGPAWMRALAAPAWLAVAMALSALVVLAWSGLLSGAWQLLLALPLAAWALLTWLGGAALWAAWQPAWPLHLGCMLALPLLLRALVQPRPRAHAPQATPAQRLQRWGRKLATRRHLLDPSGTGLGRYLWLEGLALSFFMHADVLPSWGGPQGPGAVLRVLAMAGLTAQVLQSRDLHWRMLLAPHGALRHQLGLRVWRDSLRGLALPLALVAFVLMALDTWVHGAAPLRWLGIGLPALLELTLAVGLATLVRGLVGTTGRSVALLGTLMLPWSPLLWLQPAWMQGTRGPVQMLGLMVACIVMLPLVRAAWRRVDLGTLAAQADQASRASASR